MANKRHNFSIKFLLIVLILLTVKYRGILFLQGLYRHPAASQPSSASIVYKMAVTAIAHIVAITWSTTGGTGSVLPVTHPTYKHISLLIEEVSV